MPLTRGRPKIDNPRTKVRSVHLTEQELELIESAAARADQPVTLYIREKAVAAARRSR